MGLAQSVWRGRPDLAWTLEYSDDLASWQPVEGQVMQTVLDAQRLQLEASDTGAGARRFYRAVLRLEAAP
ncbi:MAG: hypothetical protein IPL39_22230 [Opitutaceae bacterium]|nr:hypothetical protein [Opitutaceae bacterium]